MTSDRYKCGLSSLLPMSCRGRAEAFARRLHSRLSSLGSDDNNDTTDEKSWLVAPENSTTQSQPRHTDSDLYYSFGSNTDSPDSSEEETIATEIEKIINEDNLNLSHSTDCHCSVTKEKNLTLFNTVKTPSFDSDSSDGPFYDSENDLHQQTLIEEFCNSSNNDDILKKKSGTEKSSDKIQEINVLSEWNFVDSNLLVNNEISTLNVKDVNMYLFECNSDFQKENSKKKYEDVICVSECDAVTNEAIYSNSVEHSNVTTNPEHTQLEFIALVSNKVNTNNDNDDTEEPVPRIRRCSSLKTGKTPPGTPGRKKIVRFADVLGLDLADVRTFLDEIPKIPNSAYNDLSNVELNDTSVTNSNSNVVKFCDIKVEKILIPLFQQPGGQSDFIDKIREKEVCLDNALVEDPVALIIKGTVRVKNLDYHKSVHIRYSLDSWQSFADLQAIYVENSCDGFSDKFSFTLYAHNLAVEQKLEFAIRFQCKGCQYWDNNNGINYIFQCLPATNSTSVPSVETITDDNKWGASFYY